jgi:type IV secretion system protein VirD4
MVVIRRLSARALLLCVLAFIFGEVLGQDASYIAEMPTVATVQRQIGGANQLDRLAHQAAVYEELKNMARVQIGNPDALANLGALSRAERELLQSYLTAQQAIFATPGIDRSELNQRALRYGATPGFAEEVAKLFFSPAWLKTYEPKIAAYERLLAERSRAQPAPQPPRTAPGVGGDDELTVGAIVVGWIKQLAVLGVIVGGLVWFVKRARGGNKHAERDSSKELARLGATQEARTKSIDAMFDRKTETINADIDGRFVAHKFISGRLVRSLAAMSTRERESLRVLYHLHNIGQVTAHNFYFVRLGLLWADGKGQVFKPWFEANDRAKDFASAMRAYTGIETSEGAVTTVLHYLADATAKLPNHPVVAALADRLVGGGAVALTSTAAFRAEQSSAKPGLVLGIAEDTGEVVSYRGEGSVISVAPPGAGKTQCHVFPTLLTWKGPAVVLDVKGEIYAGTSKWRRENVGPVFKFSPLDPSTSANWNPLTAVRSDPEYLWEDSRFLADMMMVPSNSKDPFWENRARDVLTAAIARTCLEPDPAKRSFGEVLDVFHGVGWDTFVTALQMAVDMRSLTRAGNSLKEMEPKTRDGVLQTGLASLSAWDGDRIERTLRKSDWNPRDLRGGGNPTIYICLKPNEVESYVSILRVFIAQHIRALTAELPSSGAAPILFLLDELPRLRRMPPVEEALEIGRQYGIRLWMFAQSLGQLENAYENAEGMIGSCAVRMFMNPSLHDETAQKLSDQIGLQEGVLDDTRQKIVEAPTLAGPEYRDHVIVMASGFKPFRLRKSFAYADPTIKARMGSL